MELRGGQSYRTMDSAAVFQVTEGEVLVYILPYEGTNGGKRLFLCQMEQGEVIPGLYEETADGRQWSILLLAREAARILPLAESGRLYEARAAFAEKCGVSLPVPGEFSEELIEKYYMAQVKDEAYIYSTAMERKRSHARSAELIARTLQGKKAAAVKKKSGSPLYDAVSFLCGRQGIRIRSYEEIRKNTTGVPDVWDIAGISGFMGREISLPPCWWKKDIGPLLLFQKDGHRPLACYRKGLRYHIYDAGQGEERVLTGTVADGLEAAGVMLYRSFSGRQMSFWALLRFSLAETPAASFLRALLLTVLGTLLALTVPSAYQYLYDLLIPAGSLRMIYQFGAMILACMAGYMCFVFARRLVLFGNVCRMENAVMAALYDRLMHLPEALLREYDSAELAQRAIRMMEVFRQAAAEVAGFAMSMTFSLACFIRMITYDGRQAVLLALPVLLLMAVLLLFGRQRVRVEKRKQDLEGRMGSTMFQFISGIQKIRTEGAENRALYEYLKMYVKACGLMRQENFLDLFTNTLAVTVNGLYLLILFAASAPLGAQMGAGRFAGLLSAAGLFAATVTEAVLALLRVDFALPVFARCRPILECGSVREEAAEYPGRVTGNIEVSNVSFSYQKGEPVLQDISLHIRAGEYVGIVGVSGCGKSTLFQILLGLEAPDKGYVFYDGKNLENLNKQALRKKIGVVLQEESLFTGSIFENIASTAPDITMDKVLLLLDEAGMGEDIRQMPMGVHTLVTESGSTISGGQRQKILIARALARRPSILFLDEATSALDNLAQEKIVQGLGKQRMTRVVIAHRISAVRGCDRIFLMEEGRIAEEGSFETLMERKGRFYQLAKRQMT